jgi:hypothetical protein
MGKEKLDMKTSEINFAKQKVSFKTTNFTDENIVKIAEIFPNVDIIIKELAHISKKRDILRVLFRDSVFASDDVKDNVSKIFKQFSVNIDIKVI